MSAYENWINSGRGEVMLYLPLKDAATAHINEAGTGDFTQNGLLMTADRGANQDNCVASKFDGVDDYLSRTSLTGAVDSSSFSLSLQYNKNSTGNTTLFYIESGTQDFKIENTDDRLRCQLIASGGGSYVGSFDLLLTSLPIVTLKRNNIINCSYNGVGTFKLFVNGIDATSMVTTNIDNGGIIDFTGITNIGKSSVSDYYNGSIGELYFDTNYIDLATNNPFWDSLNNKPIPVRKMMKDTGAMPLIAMPIDASNPGKNYGTSGDFTLYG